MNETFDHETTEDCPCGPTVMPVQRSDGSYGWVYVHHALSVPRQTSTAT